MKTRVYKYGADYYPQYRKWFIWRFIVQNKDFMVNFSNKEKAVEFCKATGINTSR